MNEYLEQLHLTYDPFAPGVPSKDFFAGGERRLLVDQLIELSLDGNRLAAVTGPLGCGKSTLAREISRSFAGEAVCVLVPATLFMNQAQFIDALGRQLPKHKHIAATPDVNTGVQRLRQFASELDLEAQSLILLVDDAHELSAEVIELIDDIVSRPAQAGVRVILLGEKALINLLQNTLADRSQADLAHFEIPDFDIEDTREYLRFKLTNAGCREPLPLGGGLIGQIQNSANGIPGAINALAAQALTSNHLEQPQEVPLAASFTALEDNFEPGAGENLQMGLDMDEYEQVDEDDQESSAYASSDFSELDEMEEFADHRNETPPLLSVLVGYANENRISVAASLVAVVMLLSLLMWNPEPAQKTAATTGQLVANANGENINRIQLAPPIPQAATGVAAQPVAAVGNESAASPVDITTIRTAVTDTGISTEADEISESVTVSSEPVSVAAIQPAAQAPVISAPAKPVPAEPVKTASTLSGLSAYEQELLSYPASNYTIQILGAGSEANVKKFVADKRLQVKHGYYETRHQSKPWYVVVAGKFSNRAAASAEIEKMPEALRDMQPWIRSMADVQRDIRSLHEQ